MTHYHVSTDCQDVTISPVIVGSESEAESALLTMTELIINTTNARIKRIYKDKAIFWNGSTVQSVPCNENCRIS